MSRNGLCEKNLSLDFWISAKPIQTRQKSGMEMIGKDGRRRDATVASAAESP